MGQMGSKKAVTQQFGDQKTALSATELWQVLQQWNQTQRSYADHKYLPAMIEEQAQRTPSAVALIYHNNVLTYQELNQRANQLAHYLQYLGVAPEVKVGICAERSIEMVVALLAILKAGGAYVPLDPEYPVERLRWMIDDAGATLLLTQLSILECLSFPKTNTLCLDQDSELFCKESSSNPHPGIAGENAAYVIYTSGSTGRPKGVVNTHAGIRNRLLWMQEMYQLTAADRLLQKTSFSFDVSVWEFFWPLLAGAGLVLARPGGQRDSRYLVETIRRQRITTLHFVPSMLASFLEEPGVSDCWSLRQVICSGEALSSTLARYFHTRCQARLHNLYGPTEAAIDVTCFECVKESLINTVPIGRPIANMQMYVLDSEMEPVAVAMEGNLYIGGVGLGRGYLNRAELTAERFLPNPFSTEPGARLYLTGDRGRWTADGTIEYLGRSDSQVKIRGYRIELDEIAGALREHSEVQDAVVVAYERQPGDKQLVAYIVPRHRSARYVLGNYRLANGLCIAHQNKNETDYLYREIFELRTYLRHGIRLKENACVFDVGANIGIFSLFVSEQAPAAKIYAFEPLPPLFETLRFNAALCMAEVNTFDFGLSDKEDSSDFIYYPRNTMMSGLQAYSDREQDITVMRKFIENEQARSESAETAAEIDELLADRFDQQTYHCRVRRLSDVIAEKGIEHIELLKVDVERAELDVLKGIDEHDWNKIEQAVVEAGDTPGSAKRIEEVAELLQRHAFHVTIEEDERLKGTGLYSIYAVRNGMQPHETGTPQEERAVAPKADFLSVDVLRNHLKQKLPEYMLPSGYMFLSALPLTLNGKLDRKALPPPSEDRPVLEQSYVAPRTRLEETLSRIWAKVLHVSRVGVNDNFLHLGGHSLLGAQVISRVRKIYGLHLPLRTLFDKPTLAELAEHIKLSQKEDGRNEAMPLVPVPREQGIPLGFSQERVWFLLQFEPCSIAYHFQAILKISGPLNIGMLERSLTEMVRRHEILRTTFTQKDGRPVQVIHEAASVTLPVVLAQAVGEKSSSQVLDQLIQEELQKNFDVKHLPLIRWILYSLSDREFVLLDVEHHFVHDGWGFNVFVGELLTLYKAFTSGQPSPLPPPSIQFADFAVWQHQTATSESVRAQLAYWKQKLADAQPVSEFPTDYPRPPVQTFRGNLLRLPLPLDLSRKVRSYSGREGTSLFVMMMAAFFSLIHRYSRQEDLCVGSTVANRQNPGSEGLLGMLVNNLVLRAQLSSAATFQEFVSQIRDVTLEAYENQDVPFHHVVQALGLDRNLSVNPLFQVMFNFHTAPLVAPDVPELTFELTEGISNRSAKFDLNIIVVPSSERRLRLNPEWDKDDLVMLWEFNTDLFEEVTVRRMIGHYETLLDNLTTEPQRRITEAGLLTSPEQQQILQWNETQKEFHSESCVHELFESQAARAPQEIAIEQSGKRLTYDELNRRANQLAHYLRELGVGRESLVGVSMERCLEVVISLMAVLKAGGTYLPMDPALPAERLGYILEDANVAVLLVKRTGSSGASATRAQMISLEERWKQIASEPDSNLGRIAGPENLGYVIYTSGSTGNPKGVMIEHKSLVNLLESVQQDLGISRGDSLLAVTTLSFDIAALEIFSPLLVGGRLLVGDPMQEDIQALRTIIREQGVSILQATPTLWRILTEAWEGPANELTALCGGEAMERNTAEQLLKISNSVWNMYGPTETTVWSSMYAVRNAPASITSIGKPIANTDMYVLDEEMALVPAGIPGRLYIGGTGLARGYLNRPGLTAEKFVPNPFSATGGKRLYDTGDLAKWRADGNLEFLGRRDHQVKLRGHRIELGEIEAALSRHPEIRSAVVIVRDDERSGNKQLVAYLTSFHEPAPSASAVQSHLRETLPEYMVPSQCVVLDEIPLTPNGKVDRKALLARSADHVPTNNDVAYRAPRNMSETALVAIWKNILGIKQIGVHDNFFALGGHSLLAVQVISRIRAMYSVDLSIRTVFERPTVASLAEGLENTLIEGTGKHPNREEPRIVGRRSPAIT